MSAHFELRVAARVFHGRGGVEIRALDDVSLTIERGVFLAVRGPSGGGKTTLLSLLAALDRPTSGEVRFAGEDLGGASHSQRGRVRRKLGLVFQHSHMVRGLPLWENVTYPLVPRGVPSRERRRLAEAMLERVGVAGRALARPEELSGGERQRVGVARALVGEPEALLADEPTSDLDRESAAAVRELFRSFHAAGGTIVLATHDDAFRALATAHIRLEGGSVRNPRTGERSV